MPQMAPLNWLILFFMFIMILILISLSIYSSFLKMIFNNKNLHKFTYKWKW